MTSSEHEAVLRLETDEPERLLSAIAPDIGSIPGDASVEAECRGDALVLTVAAPTLSSLRAGIKSWTSLLAAADAAPVH